MTPGDPRAAGSRPTIALSRVDGEKKSSGYDEGGAGQRRHARQEARAACPAAHAQCGGKLQRHVRGPAHEVFAKVLRGLSGTKLTKPGSFINAEGSGHAVRCSFKVRANMQERARA